MYTLFIHSYWHRGGIATLSDYQSKPGTSSGDKGQEYFAGGSEHSGQMIEGPPRKKQTPDSIAKEVFESAKKWVVDVFTHLTELNLNML